MKKILVPFFVLALSGLYAQKQADVSLELLDGNIIKGTAMVNDIDLVTAYGKLVIPVSKINHIEVGIGRDNSVSEKAKGHLKILATSNNEDTRKSSYTDLVKLGIKAIPAINDFFNDPKNI